MTWINFFAAIGLLTVTIVALAVFLIWLIPQSIVEMEGDDHEAN